MNDLRDPMCVGHKLLSLAEAARKTHPELKLSVIADRSGLRCPPWEGDGFMSNDPAEHHSKTPQGANVGTEFSATRPPGFSESVIV